MKMPRNGFDNLAACTPAPNNVSIEVNIGRIRNGQEKP